MGGAYRKAGRIDDAIFLWEKSLELDPDFSFPAYNLGAAYLERGDKDQALEYFEEYKANNYDSLSPEEKEQIDELIKQCRKR